MLALHSRDHLIHASLLNLVFDLNSLSVKDAKVQASPIESLLEKGKGAGKGAQVEFTRSYLRIIKLIN